MYFARKVVVAVNLNLKLEEILKPLKGLDFLKYSEVHLVHVFQTTSYALGFSEYPLIYPLQEDQQVIEQSVTSLLQKIGGDLFGQEFEGKLVTHCLFSDNPKKKFCEYLQDQRAELAIVASRQQRGLFESSFAQYVARHSDAHLMVLKQRE
jgi:hypothetical protein